MKLYCSDQNKFIQVNSTMLLQYPQPSEEWHFDQKGLTKTRAGLDKQNELKQLTGKLQTVTANETLSQCRWFAVSGELAYFTA